MITETSQRITGFISMKSEILSDHAGPCARATQASPRRALTVTTPHSVNGIGLYYSPHAAGCYQARARMVSMSLTRRSWVGESAVRLSVVAPASLKAARRSLT
jgi:hypothetical protein